VAGLSVITPTRNPHYSFHQRIARTAVSHPGWQIIVIDDHSEIPVEQHLPKLHNIEVYRNCLSLGAGSCRNIGIQQISKEYTVFLDDDDEMHWDVVQSIVMKMEASPSIDVSFSLYDMLFNGTRAAALETDCIILGEALQWEQERVVSLLGHEMLLAFTNYPWNKVYRSSFLKKVGLHSSETPVQNGRVPLRGVKPEARMP
jgi:glycosyltransferase involved in cell wall biosynthesis